MSHQSVPLQAYRHRLSLAKSLILPLALVVGSTCVYGQELTGSERTQIDAAVQQSLDRTKVPSASVGVARGGKVVYARAFGSARLDPPTPADAAMAYPVGSISKQFTATCILILQEQGKLKLDDPVGKWFPEFTRANEVTIRNLLTHTSGYSDYAPQDYTIPAWTKPVDSYKLVREWATKPLDFEPGTKWQYSNTNFQMAALIVSKVSGQSFHDFLWQNVIKPLKLEGVLDLDTDRGQLQVRGYERHALGPMRPAILEAPGWYSGDGGLAMPVATLMAWDESIVHRTLLKPASYEAMETPFMLKDGSDSRYGLGLFVQTVGGKRILSHSGEVGGFVSNNVIDVDDDIAWAALTNFEGPGASAITTALRPVLTPNLLAAAKAAATPANPANSASTPAEPKFDPATAAQMKQVLQGMQDGKINRKQFTADTSYYFSPETLADFQNSLKPLGKIESVTQVDEELRGGMVFRVFAVKFPSKTLSLNTYTQKDGKIEQFLVNER